MSMRVSSKRSRVAVDPHESACLIFAFALVVAAALRLQLSLVDDGIYWPDEIYQSVEPAHRLVFGYGFLPWEFASGARNWAFAGMVAGLMRVSTWVFGDAPLVYLLAIRLFFSALSLVTAFGTMRLARGAGANRWGAAIAGCLYALAPVVVYFAPRALSECAAAAAVVWGMAWVLDRNSSARTLTLGASLLGLSVLFRLQSSVFCVGCLSVLVARRRLTHALLLGTVLAVWACIYGALDWLTWGRWFNSVFEYLHFNLVEGKSSKWGSVDPGYYFVILWTSMPLMTACLIPLMVAGVRRCVGITLIALLYFLIHSSVGHKEFRFVVPALPLLFAIAGVGFGVAVAKVRVRPGWLAAGLTGCALVAAGKFHELTFGDVGQYGPARAHDSAYDDHGPLNRLLLRARQQPDLCGLIILGTDLAWSGGYSYLHKNVPIYAGSALYMGLGQNHFNYALALGDYPGRQVASEGRYHLVRLPRAKCTPDSSRSWLLP